MDHLTNRILNDVVGLLIRRAQTRPITDSIGRHHFPTASPPVWNVDATHVTPEKRLSALLRVEQFTQSLPRSVMPPGACRQLHLNVQRRELRWMTCRSAATENYRAVGRSQLYWTTNLTALNWHSVNYCTMMLTNTRLLRTGRNDVNQSLHAWQAMKEIREVGAASLHQHLKKDWINCCLLGVLSHCPCETMFEIATPGTYTELQRLDIPESTNKPEWTHRLGLSTYYT